MQLNVTGSLCEIVEPRDIIAAGSVGVFKAEFAFDEVWDGLTKTAVFINRKITRSMLLDVNDECIIPWEVLEHSADLYIGCVGVDENKIITTNPVGPISITLGVDPSADPGAVPTPTEMQQIIALFNTAASAAVSAARQPYVGVNGNWYIYDIATEAYVDSGHASYGDIATWHHGTAVTGTGTGISAAVAGSKAGDMYMNDSTLNLYRATAANTWDYASNVSGTLGTRLDAAEQSISQLGARQTVSESILARLDPYTLDPDVYGVEIDFESKTFTRIAGATGLTAGANFDSITAFGGRRRCNLADNGTVNAYFGDAGYIEDGSNGQVMVEQPKFYYKVVPLKLEKNDAEEIDRIEFTAGASSDGNITITLNGQSFNVAVLASDNTATAIATKVRSAAFNGWTTGGSGATVTFTRNKKGVCAAPTFSGGTAGITANVARTQVGYIGKGFKLRKARYYVSMTKKAGFKVHPAFVQNGVEREFIYLSAHEGSLYDVSATAYILDDAQIADFTVNDGDKLSSIANAKPISGLTQDLTRRKCGILAENRGSGWYQQYAATAACTQFLFTVEYATLNSRTAIGKGVVDKASGTGNESEITGATTLLGNASGMAAGTNGLTPITYRGEENFWGNVWKFTDGMNIYCDIANNVHDLYIADKAFAESKNTDNYKNAGITLATKEGYVSAMAYNEEFDWLFVPAETTGDSALPVGDYFHMSASTNGYKIAQLGGYWSSTSKAGAFYWLVSYAPSTRYASFGGRLVYVPA